MTRLRRKLNSMFCNKVNFIFTRELSYSCCGNHHFESLDFGAFKFSATAPHTVAYFAWTFNLLLIVAWLPWTWRSCQKLMLQPCDFFPSLLPFPGTYDTVQRSSQGTKMISGFVLKLPAWGRWLSFKAPSLGQCQLKQAMSLHLCAARILIQGYFWIRAVLFSTHGVTSESSKSLHCMCH